jgi:hypothetical protein
MAIPIAETQVSPNRTQATTPEELHPVAAAFGGDIGAALEKGGDEVANRIQTLSMHMARMNYYRGEAQRSDLLNQYKTSLQTKLYGDPSDPNATVTSVGGNVMPPAGQMALSAGPTPSNVTPTATPVEIPAGVYQRQGYAAAGALQDVDQWHQQAAQNIMQQAQGLGLRNNAVLKTQMDNAWSSERMGIVKHEATQIDQAQQQTWFKGMQLDADNAVTKQDPVSLGRTIDSINEQNQVLNDHQGKDANDPIRQITSDKFVGQALNNSMTANLKSTGGDPTQFQSTLDRLHDDGKLNDTVYENATDHLQRVAKQITTQNETAVKTQAVNARMNTINAALQGKLDFNNPNTLSEISAPDPKLGEALTNYSNNKNEVAKDEDQNFADATQKIFSAGSKEQVANYTMNVLKEGNISQDRLNILVGSAMDRGKTLADLDGQSKASNPMQDKIASGVKALMNWGKEQGQDAQTYVDFLTGAKSKPVADAYNDAIKNAIIRKNPEVSTMATPPNYVVSNTSDIKFVFSRTNRKENGSGDTGQSNDSE